MLRALGAVSMAADKVVKPRERVDATASKAIVSRRGVRRQLTIAKMPGCENPADLETKHLAEREMHECMSRAGCRIVGGLSR